MTVARNALLWISENRSLRESLPKYKFIRRAVSRFMPGEQLEDALKAASRQKAQSIGTVLTHLGENVADRREAEVVAHHYVDALSQIRRGNLNAHVSVKLTHLGLDLDKRLCSKNLGTIVSAASKAKSTVWIDMEQSQYVDRTIEIYEHMRRRHRNVGVCLQSYLFRTERDVADLLPIKPAIRFVKGAYKESSAVAFSEKADVDRNFLRLSTILLGHVKSGSRLVVGTHDTKLIRSIQAAAADMGLSRTDYEFHLLYGIQTREQQALAAEGYAVRVLISYGEFWFPWYVRRLAERPANVWFVAKQLLSS